MPIKIECPQCKNDHGLFTYVESGLNYGKCPVCSATWRVCGAPLKKGGWCKKVPNKGGRCSAHSDVPLPVTTSLPPPSSVLGRASHEIAERARVMLKSHDLASNRESIAILMALSSLEFEGLSDSDRPAWVELQSVIEDARLNGQDAIPLSDIVHIVEFGMSFEERIAKLRGMMTQASRLRRDEAHIVQAMQATLTAEQAFELIRRIESIIKTEVPDVNVQKRIAERLAILVGSNAPIESY